MPYDVNGYWYPDVPGQLAAEAAERQEQIRDIQANYDRLQNELNGQLNGQIQHVNLVGLVNGVPYYRYAPAPVDPVKPEPVSKPVILEEENVKVINPFLVGCDPEFIALDGEGKHINVAYLIPKVGQEVGWDHGGDVLELRPAPAKSTFTLVKHLWDALKQTPKKLPMMKPEYRAGAYLDFPDKKLTLGGHVHLDLPLKDSYEHRYRVIALDEITVLFEHLDILPQKGSEKRRIQGRMNALPNYEYGKLGDVRKANDANRFEYRTMASWLYSPITALLCLTAAKLAAAEPKTTVLTLGEGVPSTRKVRKFFELFAEKDRDAKLVVEKVLEPGVSLRRDPDANLFDVWAKELKTELREREAA